MRYVRQLKETGCAVLTIGFVLALLLTANIGWAEELSFVQKLCDAYQNIDTITCEIRKTTKGGGRTMRMLSRVYYKKGYYVHVDNVTPRKRRIIADSKTLWYYETDAPRGFSRSISELTEVWMSAINNIPGTPMENLLKLRGLPEISLPATDEYPIRKAYQAEKAYVVLYCDNSERLIKIEFFDSSEMKKSIAHYNYSAFQKANEHCWIPCLHKAVISLPDGEEMTETRRINNLEVNKPVADRMFKAGIFFKDVEFVGDFEKMYD
ncbi:LolA family protein [Desulfonema magnum]|uniref:Lipoprotein localization domain-containing protein n=1 Tax=Desulfonema magnum TaxID=45655 RepID=A0A975BVT9_9BACT|nr:hypothetical protein [Desulfonema magnum]QTA92659.1 lipoprotein localization domain-containing protein [Desulfonema magnum]